jgi:hypothetical protein
MEGLPKQVEPNKVHVLRIIRTLLEDNGPMYPERMREEAQRRWPKYHDAFAIVGTRRLMARTLIDLVRQKVLTRSKKIGRAYLYELPQRYLDDPNKKKGRASGEARP